MLAAERDRMRVVVSGQSDALELRLIGGQWWADYRDTVEVEALTAVEGWSPSAVPPSPRARFAGSPLDF